ncbi:MAG: hypothetical protein J5994_10895 [Ruminococcus sp.]|nr:hypothetical protein [Ruminococcus sp.]
MEYYNIINQAYLDAVGKPDSRIVYKLQPLDHWENAVGEITADIDGSTSSTISVNAQNGVRRGCSLSLINENDKYTPSRDGYFWYNRKFRIAAGIEGADTYWHPQGVFICTGSEESGGTVTLKGTDKFGILSGELNVGKCTKEFSTDIGSGDIYVAEIIRMTLMRDMGNGMPLDPIQPQIDPYFETAKLYADMTLSVGQYYGEIIITLANMYGADTYYDPDGRLIFRRKATYNIPSWYCHQGYLWRFPENDPNIFAGAAVSRSLDGINAVTVSTDNANGEIFSYTAKNRNAESPINVKAIGERYPDDPVVYISVGDTTRETAEEKCRQYAEYLLLQSTSNSVAETFTSPFVPHFDVDRVIAYKDSDYLIKSLTLDLTAKRMQVRACNVAFLPSNQNISE